mgnify:FL=1|jgi:hypothetical protein
MIIYISIGLIFALSVLTVYSLIQLGKNNILTFFLIPLALVASIFTGYTLFALQGTPINDMPKGQVEVIWVEIQKPNIYFLVRPAGETQPVYHRIPYTNKNADKMAELQKKADGGRPVTGEFKEMEKGKNDMSRSEDIRFDEIERSPLPTKKPVLRDMGVDENLINEIHNQDVGDNTARDYSPIGSNIIDPEESMKSCNTHFGCGP